MFETQDTKVCRGCLSSDRKLASISADDLKLYYTFLMEDRKPDPLTTPGIALCWECKGILRRAQIFRAQVQRAHKILEEMLGLPLYKTTLSSLTFQHKFEYDVIFEDTEPNDQPLFLKTKVPHITVDKIVIPTKYKAIAKEDNEKNFKDVSNSNLTKFNYNSDSEIEYISDDSDDSDHYENVNTGDRDSSSPELTIKRITPQEESQDVKIFKPTNLNNGKSGRAAPQYKVIRTNRVVKNHAHLVPIVKTPVLAKLELELQKFMQNEKNNIRNVTAVQESKSKQKKSKKVSTEYKTKNAGSSDDLTKIKNDSNHDDHGDSERSSKESSSEDEASASKRDKRRKVESDPDFSAEEDDKRNSETEGKDLKVQNENGDSNKKMYKPKRYKRTIMRYKHINDVLACFTEIEMSMEDLKSALEKEDAIVDEKKPIKCSICGVLCRLQRHLSNHASAYHKATHAGQFKKGSFHNPPPTIPEEPRLWRCSACFRLMRRAHVLAHMNAYHRTQYFCNGNGCEWSMKGFWVKEEHNEHWKEIHKQFVCDICGARKSNKPLLEYHVQTVHLKMPPQQCPHCERSYVHAKGLERHIQLRHSEPEPPERRYCIECDITFPTVLRLQQHFHRKHSEIAKTKYPCGECGRELATKGNLRNHYDLFHAGKTRHCCHICGKYFSKSQARDNHVNSSHLNIKLPKTKPCVICGRKFQTNRILRQHMCTHTGERPYKCAHCEAAYTQPYCLRTHLSKAHGVDEVVRVLPHAQ